MIHESRSVKWSRDGPLRLLKKVPEQARPGIVLLLASIASLIIVNSMFGEWRAELLQTVISVGVGEAAIALTVSSWVKNLLMAAFFFYAGLELKRELREGELSIPRRAALPAAGALGGVIVPAFLYLLITSGTDFTTGWAVPAATDIAFALAALAILATRVPPALKAFLLAVAVVDDLAAITIVAVFYSGQLSWFWLGGALAVAIVLVALNRLGVASVWAYVAAAAPLWIALQNGGINPTVAGVAAAVAVPMRDAAGGSPLHRAETAVRPYVLYLVLPVFALAAAGAVLSGPLLQAATHPIAVGIGAGLVIGKPVGILLFTLLTASLLRTQRPGSVWQLVGVALLAGIGFTMSLFIAGLAFSDPTLDAPVKVGVYGGSIVAAALGLTVLHRSLPRHRHDLDTSGQSNSAASKIGDAAGHRQSECRDERHGPPLTEPTHREHDAPSLGGSPRNWRFAPPLQTARDHRPAEADRPHYESGGTPDRCHGCARPPIAGMDAVCCYRRERQGGDR